MKPLEWLIFVLIFAWMTMVTCHLHKITNRYSDIYMIRAMILHNQMIASNRVDIKCLYELIEIEEAENEP